MKILLIGLFFAFLSGCYVRSSVDPLVIIKTQKSRKFLHEIKKKLRNKKAHKATLASNLKKNEESFPVDHHFDFLTSDDEFSPEPRD